MLPGPLLGVSWSSDWLLERKSVEADEADVDIPKALSISSLHLVSLRASIWAPVEDCWFKLSLTVCLATSEVVPVAASLYDLTLGVGVDEGVGGRGLIGELNGPFAAAPCTVGGALKLTCWGLEVRTEAAPCFCPCPFPEAVFF